MGEGRIVSDKFYERFTHLWLNCGCFRCFPSAASRKGLLRGLQPTIIRWWDGWLVVLICVERRKIIYQKAFCGFLNIWDNVATLSNHETPLECSLCQPLRKWFRLAFSVCLFNEMGIEISQERGGDQEKWPNRFHCGRVFTTGGHGIMYFRETSPYRKCYKYFDRLRRFTELHRCYWSGWTGSRHWSFLQPPPPSPPLVLRVVHCWVSLYSYPLPKLYIFEIKWILRKSFCID